MNPFETQAKECIKNVSFVDDDYNAIEVIDCDESFMRPVHKRFRISK